MSKTMLINVTHVEESRVATIEDGVLSAYEIETINRTSIKGNIYNSVVESVHPALEAAFVRIAPDLKGFLPLDEVNFRLLPQRREDRSKGRIGQHLQPGQKLITQVVREPFAGKPPTVSTYFSLPGRYLVLMPGVESGGISRKIEDGKQRERLKQIVAELNPPDGFGLIVRTAGIGQTKTELQRDLRYLLRLWESIQKGSSSASFPGLVYQERDLVIRTIRDYFTPDINEVWIDSKETHQRALEFVKDVMPTKAKLVKLYQGDRPLFNRYNLEEQIERIYKRRVPLPSGGEIVIDGTEALTAIDVNSARSSKKAEAEDNAVGTNLEAAVEIARQLRLRDLGGLVVIDFIDMMKTSNIKKVEKAMRDAMRADKARSDVTRISKLGLMEIARQRIKGAKLGASYTTCSTCDGFGLIKTIESAALASLRKLQTRASRGDFGTLEVRLSPDVSEWILNNKREELVRLEQRQDIRVVVTPDPAMLRHACRFETKPRETADATVGDERSQAPTPAELAAAERSAAESEAVREARDDVEPLDDGGSVGTDVAADATEESKPKRRRRRRRRRGAAGAAEPDAVSVGDESGTIDDADGSKVERGTETPETADDGHGESSSDDGEAADTDRPRKRRRRRRRKTRTHEATDPEGGSEEHEPGDPRDGGEPVDAEPQRSLVPDGVRSDELMPAAIGESRSSSRRRRTRRGGGRRVKSDSAD